MADLNRVKAEDIPKVFSLVQKSSANHSLYCAKLRKTFDEQEGEKLTDIWRKCLYRTFREDYKIQNRFVKNIISFISLFLASFHHKNNSNSNCRVFNNKLEYILKLSACKNDSIRFWSCCQLNTIVEELKELNDVQYDIFKGVMLERLQDPISAIRCEAIIALCQLQDPTDETSNIVKTFRTLMGSDSSVKVRQLCVEKICLSKTTLKCLLERLRDIDANVRLSAFKRVEPLVKFIKIADRRNVILGGLTDENEKIRSYTISSLLPSWLKQHDNEYLKLMKSFRLDACEDDIVATTKLNELVLNAMFEYEGVEGVVDCLKLNENKLMDFQNINWDSISYFRILVQYLKRKDLVHVLEGILPDLCFFCQYIKSYCKYTKEKQSFDEFEFNFVLKELCLICREYDFGDSAVRRTFNELVHYLLCNQDLELSTAQAIFESLEKTINGTKDISLFGSEIIFSILHGEEDLDQLMQKEENRHLAISQTRAEITTLQSEEMHFARIEKNFSEAERIRGEIQEKQKRLDELMVTEENPELKKKTDIYTLIKCLTLAEALLHLPSLTCINPAIVTINKELILDALVHSNQMVQSRALRCYAILCTMDEKAAQYGVHLFAGLMLSKELDDFEILITSIKVVTDILCKYGLNLVENCEDPESQDLDEKKIFIGGTSLTDVVQGFENNLNHESSKVQEVTTQCICVFIIRGLMTSSTLISRLIIKWANPATDSPDIKFFISKTLEAKIHDQFCLGYFVEAFIAAIKTIVRAPPNSSLRDVDFDDLIKFMVFLCQISAQTKQLQENLALKLSHEIKEKPKQRSNPFFAKMLTQLSISDENIKTELFCALDELKDIIKDNFTLKTINRFTTSLMKPLKIVQTPAKVTVSGI